MLKIRSIPPQAIDIIKRFEGIRLTPYYCSAHKKTIGIGHVILPHEQLESITLEQAEELLKTDLKVAAGAIMRNVKVPINDNQYSALLSLVFNIGGGAFQASTLLRLLNRQEYTDAANQFPRWNKVNGLPSKGLTTRRMAEMTLFSISVLS